jgi:phenylacetate-CoA ligase
MKLPKLLIDQLIYTANHSPYYKNELNIGSTPLNIIKTYDEFENIPFTNKEQLSLKNKEFLCVTKKSIVEIVTTSGTTGEPVPIYLTNKDVNRLAENECKALKTAGLTEEDVVMLTTTSDKLFVAGLAYQLGIRKIGAALLRVGPVNPELLLQNIISFEPSVIIAVPSFIVKLIQFANTHNFDLNTLSVKKIICIGEPIRYEDFTLNILGTKIFSNWGVELYSSYASTEMCTAFTECNAFKGGHLNEDFIYAEIIDELGNKVKEGEPGELVITTLGNEAMPLIRFKTGDICHAYYKPCTCGNQSLRIGPIIGRKNQMIKYKGTSLYPSSFKDILIGINEIETFYIEIYTNELNLDSIKIHLSLIKDSSIEEVSNRIKEIIRNKIRVAPEIVITHKNEILKINNSNKRKPIDVIDNRNKINE